jgi:PI31 proteasome regulator N-terminal
MGTVVEEVGIDGWNETEDRYGFLYFKEEKGKKMRVLLKALVIGDKLPIDVVDLEEQKELLHLEVKYYVSPPFNYNFFLLSESIHIYIY